MTLDLYRVSLRTENDVLALVRNCLNRTGDFRVESVNYEHVDPRVQSPLVTNLVRARYNNAAALLSLYDACGLHPFSVTARVQNGKHYLISPPVVEKSAGSFILLDGTHRVAAAIQRGQPEIRVITVRLRRHVPPPSVPTSWGDLAVVESIADWRDRFTNLSLSRLRPIAATSDQLASMPFASADDLSTYISAHASNL